MNTMTLTSSPIRLPQQWEWDIMQRYADAAVKSGMVAGTTRADQALFVILKGYELGITPIEALSNIHLIKGKPGLSVQLMISLANRSGMLTRLDMPDASKAWADKRAVVTACRKDRPDSPVSMTFSMDDAASAGLLSNPTWKQYPGQMLVNRAMSMVLRRIIPEALSGMYLAEELENSTTDTRPDMTYTALPESAVPVVPALPRVVLTPETEFQDRETVAAFVDEWRAFGLQISEITGALNVKRMGERTGGLAAAHEAVRAYINTKPPVLDEAEARAAAADLADDPFSEPQAS